jgi:hypothetical protein
MFAEDSYLTRQDDAAEDARLDHALFLDGFGDGSIGAPEASTSAAYLEGYDAGRREFTGGEWARHITAAELSQEWPEDYRF